MNIPKGSKHHAKPKHAFYATIFMTLLIGFGLFYLIFITAYSSPNQQLIIAPNLFNEADFELVCFSLIFILGIIAVQMYGWDYLSFSNKDKIVWSSIVLGSLFMLIFIFLTLTKQV